MSQVYLPTGKHCGEKHRVKFVLVDPSAASWVCILKDSAGNTIFTAKGSDAVARSYPVNIDADAFNMTTATNLTGIMLYT